MKNLTLLLVSLLFAAYHLPLRSQDIPLKPTLTGTGTFHGTTPPLKDLPVLSAEEYAVMKAKAEKKALNKKMRTRSYPYAEQALPKGPDPVWQQDMGSFAGSKAPLVNIDGQTSPYYPPDCNGTAGPNHYMQTINSVYAIYNKTGTLVAGPTNMNLLFSGVTGATCNDGDPLVLYDEQAGRWLAVEFSICGSNDYMLVAVSTTNDPTGTWNKYSFDVADMPDYEKFGIWQDGYYMGTNNSSGNDIYVFERSVMIAGGSNPQMVGFNNAWRPTTIDGFMCVPPVDNDGTFAPSGSPGLFITINDDAIGGGSDQLWIYELTVNWSNTASSTFVRSQQLSVPSFDSNFGNTWSNIPQPNGQKVDAIPMVIMHVPQYRNFGSYQTLMCCHTVDVDASDHAGIRWYELRRTTGAWSVRQSGTYAPDALHRWMGSIMLNGSGQIGLGYSVSSSTVYPSIRYCGQSAGAYASASGTLDITEESIIAGAYAQSSYNRWGDYALMSVDPADDKTFWFTTQYIGSGGSRKTRIASFKYDNSPSVVTQAATAITGTAATLNGTVNPNGLATNYYFQWGTTTSYGNTTATTSAGSGTASVAASAGITGLVTGTTYHFRLAGVNNDGTTYGNDLTFTPGAASVTTTAASAITMSGATAGGNVVSDGGSPVTARGVCWATTTNPTISGNHTTDGSGTGFFTSTLTGLSANTTYHIRAYATNAGGTVYGQDLSFTTLCGIVTAYPWNEGFENGGLIPNCWSQEQVNSSGVNWTFITGNGGSYPATAHGGTYNACLKDNTSADNKTRLITPTLNLSSLSGPQLKFWHTQAYWSPDQDLLTVYYKTSAGGTWTQLAYYSSSITTWTQETINLPGASADYYIAFEGNAKYGYGVCIDDVQVTGSCTVTYPVSLTIAASLNPICAGTQVSFTATPVNGGSSPVYQWKVNGTNAGTNNAVYTYAPVNNDAVSCVVTSNLACTTGNPATSNTVTMTVNPTSTVGINISPSVNPVCEGTPVNFTATPVNGGASPQYQWKVNAVNSGTNAPTFTFSPENGDVVSCVLTSSVTCPSGSPATSNSVIMSVGALTPVSVYISASANNVCTGSSVTYTATPAGGGSNPSYQWRVNGSNAGSNSHSFTYTPLNGDQVSCILTSGITCASGNPATSNTISMTVLPVSPVSISITASENPVCEGTEVLFTATAINGGGNPLYEWMVNGITRGTNGPIFTWVPMDNESVTCKVLSNASCVSGNPATSQPVVMEVIYLEPAAVNISPDANPVNAGTTVTFTANPVNGGTNPQYQWYLNGTPAGTGGQQFQFIPQDHDGVYCVMTSSNPCTIDNPATSATIYMVVNPVALNTTVQNVIIGNGQDTCYNASQTIVVAGEGTQFTIETGGMVTMIAGQSILYLPNTTVDSGAYLHGYITETGEYCGWLPPAMVTVTGIENDPAGRISTGAFIVYPNPTRGSFTLELSGGDVNAAIRIEIVTVTGQTVLSAERTGGRTHTFSLETVPPGIYVVHVRSADRSGVIRIIRAE